MTRAIRAIRRCEEFLYCVKAAGYADGSAASGRSRPAPRFTATTARRPGRNSTLMFEPSTRRRSARGEGSAHEVCNGPARRVGLDRLVRGGWLPGAI